MRLIQPPRVRRFVIVIASALLGGWISSAAQSAGPELLADGTVTRAVILPAAGGKAIATFVRQPQVLPGKNPQNGTYVIDGVPITLVDGVAETDPTSGSTSKRVTRYFGNALDIDLNGDGKMDLAFLLVQNSGGSGTFYYVVAAIHTPNGFIGTNAILIGDRIAPQYSIRDPHNPLQFIVTYAERKAGEAMSVQPSQGVSKTFKLEGNMLVEVAFSARSPGHWTLCLWSGPDGPSTI